jgi:non-specific serine/threonine protein kinase/serine/threonine-protein kinase
LLTAGRAASTAWDRPAIELEARNRALDSRPARPGEFFGPYRIVRRIAAGGMGLVYEALRDDAEFHKRVAIKFVQYGIDDPASIDRFRAERQILAQLEHPHIARLLDGGTTDDGVPYLVMEYVDGVPIDRFAAEQKLSCADHLKLFLKVCEAVQYAHRNLVVHRDLKPGNILVTPEVEPKLLDFGIAKLLTDEARPQTATVRALTPEYASPEQVEARSIGTASDVYSLGVLLFSLLTERLPYRTTAAQPAELVRAICEEEPVWDPPGLIESDLKSILAQALRKEPERRYLSVEQFAGDIRRYLEGRPVTARGDTLLYRARKFVVRRAIPLAAATAVIAAVIIGALTTLAQSRRAERRFNEVRSLARSFLYEVYDSINTLPGSVGTRRLVASRAQQYLDSLAREAGNDPSLTRELAESYLRLGDVRGRPYTPNLGDTAGALEAYRKALGLLDRESVRNPKDASILDQLAEAYMNVSVIFMRQQDGEAAGSAAQHAIATAQILNQRFPQDAVYTEKLSHAYMRLGQAQHVVAQKNRSVDGLKLVVETYKKAHAVLESAGPHLEEFWQQRLATTYFYIEYPLRDLGDLTGERSYYRQGLESALKGNAVDRQLLAAYPEKSGYVRRLADGLAEIGLLHWKCCRDLTSALRDEQEALSSFEKIAQRDPQNLEAQSDVAGAYRNIGIVLGQAGKRIEALAADRKALTMYEQLSRADPANVENAQYAAAARERIAQLGQHLPSAKTPSGPSASGHKTQ